MHSCFAKYVQGGITLVSQLSPNWHSHRQQAYRTFPPVLFDILTSILLNIVEIQDWGRMVVPLDAMIDCMDVFELVCNAKGLSNETTQRSVWLFAK